MNHNLRPRFILAKVCKEAGLPVLSDAIWNWSLCFPDYHALDMIQEVLANTRQVKAHRYL
jgi:hypothetical protein